MSGAEIVRLEKPEKSMKPLGFTSDYYSIRNIGCLPPGTICIPLAVDPTAGTLSWASSFMRPSLDGKRMVS